VQEMLENDFFFVVRRIKCKKFLYGLLESSFRSSLVLSGVSNEVLGFFNIFAGNF
jgi:hypothetical protein